MSPHLFLLLSPAARLGETELRVHDAVAGVSTLISLDRSVILPYAAWVKRCIFCRTDLSAGGVQSTVEHIVPQWLQREWRLESRNLSPTHWDERGNVISTRTHSLNAFVAGGVCATCNNGWMSALETACRPLITDLAADRRRVTDLANEEALLLARWTAKTAWALHAASNYRRIVPEDHYMVLGSPDYRLPDGVRVVAHGYKSGRDFSWVQTTTWQCVATVGIPKADMTLLRKRGYKIALKLGGLYLMIYHNPLPHTRESLFFGKHIPLYPRWSHPVTWVRNTGPWPSKEMVRFYTFAQMLGIAWGATQPNYPPPKARY